MAETCDGFKARDGFYGISPLELPVAVTLVFDVPTAIGGRCTEVVFPATPPATPSCVILPNGRTLRCK